MPTPNLYIEEQCNRDLNITALETSIPCFIGYTEKALLNDSISAFNSLVEINSLIDFQATFGTEDTNQNYYLFYSIQSYYNNGGGQCYIFSIGDYARTSSELDFSNALTALSNLSEKPYQLIVATDSVKLNDNEFRDFSRKLLHFCKDYSKFCILDTRKDDVLGITFRNSLPMVNLSYGAAYSPWLKIEHKNEIVEIPASGAIAAIYKQVDTQRGVWKSPSNISLSNTLGVTKTFNPIELNQLHIDANEGKSINPIRPFTGKGIVVWGTRTLAGNDNEWRYVTVRRFINMIQTSIEKSLAAVVFEPNDANTWIRIKGAVENFLASLWMQGALMGGKTEHAYFVKIGLNETMTKHDVENGHLKLEIGLACIRPAEFIIIKIYLKMAI